MATVADRIAEARQEAEQLIQQIKIQKNALESLPSETAAM